MKKFLTTFRLAYLIYAGVLVALVIAATAYVGSLLRDYEESQPQNIAQQAVNQFLSSAKEEDVWQKYNLPQVSLGGYEAGLNLKEAYLAQFSAENLKFVPQTGVAEDELLYNVESDGFCLAQVKLKADGPTYTKLAVFSMRDWNVESFTPALTAHDYTLTVPASFDVKINGVTADGSEKNQKTEYSFTGLYLKPELTITDESNTQAQYTFKKNKIVAKYFDFSLTLPATLSVEVNGAPFTGTAAGNNQLHYSIASLTKPEVKISDLYGNTVAFDGSSDLPLTYATITADERYSVQVLGKDVPAQAVTVGPNPEYAGFADFVKNLPGLAVYQIAVLMDDAEIAVKDIQGNPVTLDESTSSHNFTLQPVGLDTVPDSVSSQVNVLDIAQKWSLFLTRDYSFSRLKQYILPKSYQYDVAYKYATSIDYTFVSSHTLFDPPFVDNLVTNFVWITDDCFSVDISFVKRMNVARVGAVDDPMNDRFYFVKYDSTNDKVDNPVWMLASMKEIVTNAD